MKAVPNLGSDKVISDKLPIDRNWKAHELRSLPAAEREAILSEAAALAESEYRGNPRLTDFEAFGEDDLHGESSAAQEG